MSSELFLYSKHTFIHPHIIKYIASNISFYLINNTEYKPMYFEGKNDDIKNFILILEKSLGNKVKYYKRMECISLAELPKDNFVLIEEDNTIKKCLESEKYSKIYINHLNKKDYLTDSESVIIFKKNNFKHCFDINLISEEFGELINKIVNNNLKSGRNYIYYEEYVLGEHYNIMLYQEFIKKYILDKETFTLENILNNISNYCNKCFNRNKIKEYLLLMFDKPYKIDEWKIKWD